MSPEDAAKSAILDWSGPAFPLEVREEAAMVFADYVRKGANDTADFYMHPLQFGTGGLRGVIGNGAGRMNPWTVGRTTVGLCNYLKSRDKKKASLVIAHDSRRMSPEFAQTTAGIAASLGLKVYLFDGVTPTPVLSYAIRKLKASGGVVITASHNPPEYNGYKVYIDDGSQLVGDAQVHLEDAIAAVSGWEGIPFLFEKDPVYKRNVKKVGPEIKKSYYAEFKRLDFVSTAKQNKAKSKLKIIYSPLHGTGGPWLPGLLKQYGFNVEMVPEQEKPDGEFPTVKYPNPEEPEALKLSEELARTRGADIFLATDPDADRLGAGVRNSAGGYTLINGNQIGSIMCAHLCEKVTEARQAQNAKAATGSKKKNKAAKEPRYHVLKTIVTTDLQKEIAEANGIEVRDVLTGFKYIAEQMKLMEKGDKAAGFKKGRDEYLFGGEESFGYLPVDFVRDKDALASALLLCEVLAERGDLLDYLNQIYLKYGLYLEDLKSITLKGSAGQARIQEIIDGLREQNLIGWKLGDRTVTGVLDYKNQTRDGKKDPKVFGLLPPANVVQLLLEPEGKLTIRPSGTEPKVKLYASLHSKSTPSSLDELQLAMDELQNELASISGHFFARTGLA
ncbi:MAG: phospho-sugar mutase [bacterium]|nr:phospho-sugar mutase [bacterium]